MAQNGLSDVGLIGLAVMGQNLALNMADHGFAVSVYNRTTSKMEDFVADHTPGSFGQLGGSLDGQAELEDFVNSLEKPRRIVVMVAAGKGTDAVIESLLPLLDAGDLIVDGGNAHWEDTIRREKELKDKGILFVGTGVSGGEEGARFGPSLMPGGNPESWERLEPIWTAIAAKVDPKTGKPNLDAEPGRPATDGEPCTAFIGPGGAGHYVKMVHNGIEYADMQMICESFDLMQRVAGMSPAACADVFHEWNGGELDSYLIEITAEILRQLDPRTGRPFVDIVLDTAGQKGTGRWTAISSLQFGVPSNTIAEAVYARTMSALKEERVESSKKLRMNADTSAALAAHFDNAESFVAAIGRALYCAKICSYAQGFQLLRAASEHYEWGLKYGEIAGIWRGGCIIRARFLQKITEAYENDPNLNNLLLDPYFAGVIEEYEDAWRKVCAVAALAGVPAPAFSSALAYSDAYRTERLPANLLQAQRDYFGAHTFERVDEPRGKFFHLDWPAEGRPENEA